MSGAPETTLQVDKRPRCKSRSAEGLRCELHKGHAFKHFGIVFGHPMHPTELLWSDENPVAKERR